MTRLGIWLAIAATAMGGALVGVSTAPASAVDDVTPVMDTVAGPAAVHPVPADGQASVSFTWSGHDPDGSVPLTYDLREGAASTLPDDATWSLQLTNTSDTTWTTQRSWPEPDFCVEVRARDAVGNVGEWSAPVCTVIDDGPPSAGVYVDIAHWHGLAEKLHDGLSTKPVSFTYVGQDDDRVASYDVQARIAPPGRAYGSWLSPLAWRATTATTVSMHAPAGGSICFRVRAHDRSGYVGAYSSPWCKFVPYDDRAFRIRHGAERTRLKRALGHTVTRLHDRSNLMVRRHVHAQEVWVRVSRGPVALCLRVRLGLRHPRYGGCFLENVSGAVWQGFYFRPGSHGRLRIRGALQLVDAVAIIPVSSESPFRAAASG